MQMQSVRPNKIVTIILLIHISRCDSQNTSAPSDAYKHVEEYEKKTCNNEPSCYLINQVPKEWAVLPARNCMCDEDCKRYKDCCVDSSFYNKTREMEKSIFQCHPSEKFYMIANCPEDYPFPSIRLKCESSMNPLVGSNKKIFIPVTNKNKKITYGNEYCAICNNDYAYVPWNLTAWCSQEINDNLTTTSSTVRPTPFVDHHAIGLIEAKKRIEYDAESKSFVSSYNGKKYNCSYTRAQPTSIIPYLRNCVPAVSSCSDTDDKLQELCLSYTAYVHDENGKIYRNVHCARCNYVTKNLTLCNPPTDVHDRISGSSLFSTNDKASG